MNNDNVRLYEVLVFAVAEGEKDRQIGSWSGPADSELKAKELAEADLWTQKLTDEGYSPSHALRVLPLLRAAAIHDDFEIHSLCKEERAALRERWTLTAQHIETLENTMAQQKLYEVMVGYHDEHAQKDRWIAVWTGHATTDEEAQTRAHEAEWEERHGNAPVYNTRVKPRYVIAENWGHIFVGSLENVTRWAYDRFEDRLVNAEIQTAGRWSALTESAMKDLLESIHDNDADGSPTDFDLEEADALPEWAQSALISEKPVGPRRRAKP